MRDMNVAYCQQNLNGRVVQRRYCQIFQNRLQPCNRLFQNMFRNLSERGIFNLGNNDFWEVVNLNLSRNDTSTINLTLMFAVGSLVIIF